MRKSLTLGLGSVTSLMLVATPTIASAHPRPSTPHEPQVISSAPLAAPFNLDLTNGQVSFADGGLNLVGRLRANGTYRTLAADQPGTSGIARNNRWLAFTTTVTDEGTFTNTASGLNLWGPRGQRIYADTLAYENGHNSDAGNQYGPRPTGDPLKDACATGALGPQGPGGIDSHAYSVTSYGDGWVVADAGANALLRVDRRGRVSTLAVLPSQPLQITAEMVARFNASVPAAEQVPACLAGVTVDFEPVPTDVEVGRDGSLYVTTLPGGPESDALGARGALWKVNPWSGRVREIASGFAGATNLALGRRGEVYVSELFGGGISVVKNGTKSGFIPLPGAVAVETDEDGALYAATLGDEDTKTPGQIWQISKGKASWKGSIRH